MYTIGTSPNEYNYYIVLSTVANSNDYSVVVSKMATSIAEKKPHPRGYDCFVMSDQSPRAKEAYHCSICLLLYREPHLLSCCGAHFCHNCITTVRVQGKPCPLCQEKDFTTMLDKSLRREILELEVSCTFNSEGCTWSGKLKELERHTDVSGGLCEYVLVACKWKCGELVQKRALCEHEQRKCPNRPWYVDFDNPQVQRLAERVNKLEEVNTLLQNEVRSVKEENARLKSDIKELSTQTSLRREEFTSKLSSVFAEIQKIRNENICLREEMAQLTATLKHKANFEQNCLQRETDERVSVHQNDSTIQCSSPVNSDMDSVLSMESTSHNVAPFSFTMKSFEHRKRQKVIWFSPAFYTHSCGYKMQLRVDANGTQDGENKHTSVFVYLMKGDFDDELSWPFQGHVTIRIQNQLEDSNHYERVIEFPKGTNPLSVDRVTVGGRVKAGHGFSQFIPHLDLCCDDSEQCQYMKNDCIKFVVYASAETSSSAPKSNIPIFGRFFK